MIKKIVKDIPRDDSYLCRIRELLQCRYQDHETGSQQSAKKELVRFDTRYQYKGFDLPHGQCRYT